MLLIIFLMGMFAYQKLTLFNFLFLYTPNPSYYKILSKIIIFMCGYCLMLNHQSHIKAQVDQYSHNFFSSYLVTVTSFVENKTFGQRWKVQLKQPFTGQAWLYCFQNCPKMSPGETWWVQGKIKKINVFNNPGALNFWYRSDYRDIIGQIMLAPGKFKQEAAIQSWDILNKVKVYLYEKITTTFAGHDPFAKRVILTLLLGIGSELSANDWQIFKDTGTAHLMVVSGAHLGLLMLMVSWLVEQIYKLIPISWPIKRCSSLISLTLGLFYALLTGFGIPVQRAWLMKFFFDLKYWLNWRCTVWQSLGYSLVIILIVEPHAISYPGTYLSFLAVIILLLVPKIFPTKRWWHFLLTQLCCLIGLSPLTILWFSSIPTLGILANLLAIPWVSWILLPMAFLMVFTGNFGVNLFELGAQALHSGLSHLDNFQQANIHFSWDNAMLAWYCLFALFIIALQPNWRIITISSLGLIPLHSNFILPGNFYVDIMDVGQGLSVLIRTKNHALLYDAAGLQGKKTIASQVIVPYLKFIGLKHLDNLVLSHPDTDHIAGRGDIETMYPQAKWLVDKPSFYHKGENCRKVPDWCWDGVCFHFYQAMSKAKKKNNHSCVLEVSNNKFNILLTGDIEKQAERAIIRERAKKDLAVLLVPHHGSKTSSTDIFLKKLHPQLAIVSVAKNNSYHLPHPYIVQRYQKYHIPWLSTADYGLIKLPTWRNLWGGNIHRVA